MTTVAEEVEALVITEPGIYPMTADEYHADKAVPGGSLSSSGARKLLPPSCPALYKHDRDNGQEPRKEFDIGHAAHTLVLDDGPMLAVIDAPDWKTKAAREERDAARADGYVPLLPKDYEQVQAMADAIRQHPTAGALFTPGTGVSEQSLFWQDGPTRVWRRARPDWIPHRHDGRLVVVDYKTCRAADDAALQRAVYEHGYHQQAAWYLDGVKALGLAGDQEPAFIFVFQTKTAPYLVHLVELDMPALLIGAAKNRRALDIYRDCTAADHWPGFNNEITYLPLPAWAEKRDQEEYL